jgi:hypothetical protein
VATFRVDLLIVSLLADNPRPLSTRRASLASEAVNPRFAPSELGERGN